MLTELEESGKQGLPQHSHLCKRPESILRTCVPVEALRPVSTGLRRLGRLPRPPRYVSPIYVDSPIAALQYLDPTSSSSLSPVDCSGDYELPIVVEGELIAGSSGGALAAPRVRVLDASGAPLAGVQVIAN